MNDHTSAQQITEEQLIKSATRFAYQLTRNHNDAEDLAQQAWMKVQKKYGEVDNRSLLFVTIRNTHYDQLRRSRIVSYSSLENAPEPSYRATPGHGLDIKVALATLSRPERLVLQLNVFEGKTAIEIGEKLGMPRGTVLSHMSRARKKLREALGHEMGYTNRNVA